MVSSSCVLWSSYAAIARAARTRTYGAVGRACASSTSTGHARHAHGARCSWLSLSRSIRSSRLSCQLLLSITMQMVNARCVWVSCSQATESKSCHVSTCFTRDASTAGLWTLSSSNAILCHRAHYASNPHLSRVHSLTLAARRQG